MENKLTVEQWLAIRKEAGLHIDPETAEVMWTYAQTLDPCGIDPNLPKQPVQRRMKAAAAALPFEHPKLAVVATTTSEDLVERLQRAHEASMKVISSRPVQVIEPPKAAQVDEVPDHSKPFARLRRF
jgi:hypothetical protein